MKIIATLRAHEVHPERPVVSDDSYGLIRDAVRIIVTDSEGKIALNFYPEREERKGGYMLPGGGVDEGETLIEAAVREAKEELGCNIKNITEIGVVLEYGVGKKTIHAQKEHIFRAELDGKPENQQPTKEELADGLEVRWLKLDEAQSAFGNQAPSFSRSLALIALNNL